MRTEYFTRYKADKQLRASLDLLRWFLLEKACSTLQCSFALIFSRIADRCLYHSVNVWAHFIDDLNIPKERLEDVFKNLNSDARLFTGDTESKYEIEAYLGAAKVLFEENLKGLGTPQKQNILGVCFRDDLSKGNELKIEFDREKDIFFALSNKIRNHAYHVNEAFKDFGVKACVERKDNLYVVTWPNVYVDESGQPLDLAKVFIDTNTSTAMFISRIRDMLLRYFSEKYGLPKNNMHVPIHTPFGNALAMLGKNGCFEFRDGTTLGTEKAT